MSHRLTRPWSLALAAVGLLLMVGVIGLGDDAGVLMLVLMWIRGIATLDRQVLRENWSGQGDVLEVIDGLHARITANADKLYGDKIWKTLQKRFGGVRRRLIPRVPRLKRG